MSPDQNGPSKQTKSLALLGIVTTEVVVLPLSWAGVFYWLSEKFHWNHLVPVFAGLVGLVFGFYRVVTWVKKNVNDTEQ